MVRALAAAGCALMLAACDSSAAPPVASQTPSNSAAESPAATLRAHLDLVLGEHVFAIAKLALAAATGRQDEYRSYAGMLAANGGDIDALFRTALGETAGGQFGDAWTEQNDDLVDYLVGAATHDGQGTAAAAAKLNASYVPHAASVLSSSLSLSSDAATQLAAGHAMALKSIIDATVGDNLRQLYTDIGTARAQAVTFGDTVTIQVTHEFADRFPGDPLAPESTQRANVSSLMQQQGYLMTLAADVTIAGSAADITAVNTALASYAAAMPAPAAVWTEEAKLVVPYAKTGDPAIRQNILNHAAAPLDLNTAFTALLQVVDDQRAKRFGNVATDDRAMAAAFAAVADEMSVSSTS